MKEAFAVWLTGLPASGKSTIARELTAALVKAGVTPEVLESDALRRVLTPNATYAPAERDLFYRALAFYGSRLVAHGIPVIFDATANRRHYRDFARELIPRFFEVAIVTPLNVCEERDYKGTYQKGRENKTATVPGLQEPYEAPMKPEVVVDTTLLNAPSAAQKIMDSVREHGILQNREVGR